MSAAEKLRALDEGLPRGIVPWARYGNDISIPEVDIVRWAYADLPPSQWEDADERAAAVLDPIVALRNALPQIVAMVEAAENAEGWMVAVRENELETFLQVPLGEWLPVVSALAALDDVLTADGKTPK